MSSSSNINLHASAGDHRPIFQGIESFNSPLAKFTTWHIGGPAEILYIPASVSDLAAYISYKSNNTPLTFIGLGSNLLIRDGGVKGLVILTKNLNELKLVSENTIYAEAGVSCAKLAKFCSKHGLTGGEFFAGIPGTVGGALAMNAGAFGGETWESVTQVSTLDRVGQLHTRSSEDYQIGYRTVLARYEHNQKEAFMAGFFKFVPNSEYDGHDKIRKLLQERNEKQPIGTRNCGSVFRNPEGDYAARLIEACGLKGFRQGGAIVSPKHANFIINDQNATSADVEQLIQWIQLRVLDKFDINLEAEVRMIGEARSVNP